jgi:hypothetical protein
MGVIISYILVQLQEQCRLIFNDFLVFFKFFWLIFAVKFKNIFKTDNEGELL